MESTKQLADETQTFTLIIKGLGRPTSFKNAKRIVTNPKTGKPFLATRHDVKKWMTQAIHSIASQLESAYQTQRELTWTELHPPALIALLKESKKLDDSWSWIPELHITVTKVPKGEEGAIIQITRL